MDTAAFLKQIDKLPGYQGQVVHVERLPARRARYGKLEQLLPPTLDPALQGTSAARLYAHQAAAINAVRRGQHVILSTLASTCSAWPTSRRSWSTRTARQAAPAISCCRILHCRF
jgi:DEAD/DEAH box helicase domain-containing protein